MARNTYEQILIIYIFICCYGNSLLLESLELSEERFIVPCSGLNLVVFDGGKGIDEMVTQTGVNIRGQVLPSSRPVLAPVGEVTRQDIGRP